MSKPNVLPPRVAIGFANGQNGEKYDVYMTPEFMRAWMDLFEQAGGSGGVNVSDLSELVAQSQIDANRPALVENAPLPVDLGQISHEIERLKKQIQALTQALEEKSHSTAKARNYSAADLEQIIFAAIPPFTDWERPGRIGLRKPNTGAFTTLSSTRNALFGNASQPTTSITNGNSSGAGGGAYSAVQNAMSFITAIGNKSAVLGGAYDSTPYFYYSGQLIFGQLGTTQAQSFGGGRWFFGTTPADDGVSVIRAQGAIKADTTLQAVGGFGCNGKTPQPAVASGGLVTLTPATNAAPYGYTTPAQANEIVQAIYQIQTALRNNGIQS